MRERHLQYLCCPGCHAELGLHEPAVTNGRIETGRLLCSECEATYPIVAFIPRFVPRDNYANSFGLEWTLHARSQYDEASGVAMSETRFFEETGWPRDLPGEIIIESGSGSGRFTEQALSTGATVLSLDYSNAVDANYASNGHHDNLLLVQGDALKMPFPPALADRLFCFGVLQHTEDPERALASMAGQVRPGGQLVVDIYVKTFVRHALMTKYWVRPITRRMPPGRLYRLTCRYVDLMWPVARKVRRLPKVGRALNWRLLIGDYTGFIADDATLREWAKLDTFDMLAPRYDKPARAKTVERWCERLGLRDPHVRRRYSRLEIHARR